MTTPRYTYDQLQQMSDADVLRIYDSAYNERLTPLNGVAHSVRDYHRMYRLRDIELACKRVMKERNKEIRE